LWLRWREGPDQPWRKFKPTESHSTLHATPLPRRRHREYLTESDWRDIQSSIHSRSEVPLALRLLAKAHELREANQVSEALIQAVTGVEVAIEYFLKTRRQDGSKDAELQQGFFGLPLRTRLAVLMAVVDSVPTGTLNAAVEAIRTRNDVVHEGALPGDIDSQLYALLECGRALLGLREMKTPVLYAGNDRWSEN